jgi:hypothetical protein
VSIPQLFPEPIAVSDMQGLRRLKSREKLLALGRVVAVALKLCNNLPLANDVLLAFGYVSLCLRKVLL